MIAFSETSFPRRPSSTHVVRTLIIPGGYDTHNARVIHLFFDDAEQAEHQTQVQRSRQIEAEILTVESFDNERRQLQAAVEQA